MKVAALATAFFCVSAAVVRAQFDCTCITNNGAITITRFTGYGSAIDIPATIGGLPVTAIADHAFDAQLYPSPPQWMWSLNSVTVPDSVTYIGVEAFSHCLGLTNVTLPNRIISIAEGTFFACIDLSRITIPPTVRTIRGGAFQDCQSLGSVAIPDSVTEIGLGAFRDCIGLASIAIPNSVTNIGQQAFSLCGLTNVTLPSGLRTVNYGLFEGCYNLTSVTLPIGLTGIGAHGFNGCTNLGSLAIPNTVTDIGESAFGYCTSLSSFIIPNGVTHVGNYAFEACGSLVSIRIPSSVTNIGYAPFRYCINLAAITVDPLNAFYSSVDGVLCDKTQTTLFEYPEGKGASYQIPGTVTNIGDYSFFVDAGLTNITIPGSVRNIGMYAFAHCTNLTSVTIPSGVITIGDCAFFDCGNLTSVALPNTLTSIGISAFSLVRLANVVIPNSVTNIGEGAFGVCYSLTNVTIGNHVRSIGAFAFDRCTGLTSVTIPDGVVGIGTQAFIDCAGLTNVVIGGSVSNIGDIAFFGCTNVLGVYFLGNAPTIDGSGYPDGSGYLFHGPYPPWGPPYPYHAMVYYIPGTTGWGATYGGCTTAEWLLPIIQGAPLSQTAEVGSAVVFQVHPAGLSPLSYLWFFNGTELIASGADHWMQITNVQFSQAGVYTVVVTNLGGAVISSPAMLQVIAPVTRRPVPGLQVMGQTGTVINIDYADELSAAPNWTTLGSVNLTNTPQYWFELTAPLPLQRFYRAWHAEAPSVVPPLGLHLVPAITLSGNIGDRFRLDYINQFGPIDAWVTLNIVTLTNPSQLYFDVSAPEQPQRLYRLVKVP